MVHSPSDVTELEVDISLLLLHKIWVKGHGSEYLTSQARVESMQPTSEISGIEQ